MSKGFLFNVPVIVLLLLFPVFVHANPSLDLDFQSKIRDNPLISGVAEQPDSKLIVRGNFCTVNGVDRNDHYLVRLHGDGTLDTSFQTGSGPNQMVSTIEILNDGKIILQGYFTQFNGTPADGLVLLNPDGSLHTAYDAGGGSVRGIALLGNGQFIVYGFFPSINGTATNHLARINMDGSVDPLFDSHADIDANAVHIQADGKLIIRNANDIIRLDSDGLVDETFDINGGPLETYSIEGSLLQQDEKLLVWGEFTQWTGVSQIYIARLNTDGSLDTEFDASLLQKYSYERVEGMAQQNGGKLILWGNALTTSDDVRRSLVRLNVDGSLDASFDNTHYFSYMKVRLSNNDDIIVVSNSLVVRLDPDGNEDPVFNANTGTCADQIIRGLHLLSNGNILLTSFDGFTSFNGYPRTRIAMLAETGVLTNFNPLLERPGKVTALFVQGDGRILVGGAFRSVDGASRKRIARLNTDGSLDTGFTVGTGIDSTYWDIQIRGIVQQSHGKIMVGGMFESYDGNPTDNLVRLNADGSMDTSYTGTGYGGVRDMDLLDDDKVYVGGGLTEINGVSVNKIARLVSDGTVDVSFDSAISNGYFDQIYEVLEQEDGNVIVGGSFAEGNLSRLNTDGSIDGSFSLTSAIHPVYNMILQADGKIVLTTNYQETLRINSNGSYDSSFSLTPGYSLYAYAPMYVLPDGRIMGGGSDKLFVFGQDGTVDGASVIAMDSYVQCFEKQGETGLIIGGQFSNVDGEQKWGLARLKLDPIVSGQITLTIAGYEDLDVRNAIISLEGTSYTTTTDENGSFELISVPTGIYTMLVTAPHLVPLRFQVTVENDMLPLTIAMQGGTCTQEQLDQAVADAEYAKDLIILELTDRLAKAENGDLDGDGDVDGADLASFAGNYGGR